jgi:hypothetical protein
VAHGQAFEVRDEVGMIAGDPFADLDGVTEAVAGGVRVVQVAEEVSEVLVTPGQPVPVLDDGRVRLDQRGPDRERPLARLPACVGISRVVVEEAQKVPAVGFLRTDNESLSSEG